MKLVVYNTFVNISNANAIVHNSVRNCMGSAFGGVIGAALPMHGVNGSEFLTHSGPPLPLPGRH